MRKRVQKAALIAGIGQLIMAILSFVIFPSLTPSIFHIIGIAIIIVLDVVVAIALYKFLEPTNTRLSLLAAVFRIIYAVIFAIALFKMPNLDAFNYVWERGLLVFGFHVLLLGILTFQSKYVPRWISILVLIASAGYIIDSLGVFWGYSWQVAMFTFIGEMIFMFWLLVKGRTIQINSF